MTGRPTLRPVGRRERAVLGVLGAVIVLVAGVLVFEVFIDDAGGGDIRLEPIGAEFETDLIADLDPRALGGALAIALPDVPPLGAALGEALDGIAVDGDEPGLYGGSRDIATCDVEQMIEFLTDPDNADKAEVWAGVHDIDVDEIAEFIDGLTPVRLRFDTRVTNHGFFDGEATQIQSVLQAGTAVLVDDEGVPRAKCACGNPLAAPGAGDTVVEPDTAWDGFAAERVVRVERGAEVDAHVLVDVDDGVLFERPVGTDGEADRVLPPGGALCDVFTESPTCTGRGRAADIAMPDLAGASVADARRLLDELGFVGAVAEREEPSAAPAGQVVGTEPPAGREVPAKSPIVLLVSAGPDDSASTTTSSSSSSSTSTSTSSSSTSSPSSTSTSTTTSTSSTTTTTSPTVTVPDVVGLSQEDAEATLLANDLVPDPRQDTQSNAPEGTVTSQDPEGGTVVQRGSAVVIFVATIIG